jgi:DNA invertase Pin-like site-specific DNA recombinase
MARIGYARVSSRDGSQDTGSQLHALASANIDTLFQEQGSGADKARPELAKALAACKAGDTFVFFQLSRVGRSTQHLLAISEDLQSRGVAMESIKESIDTRSAAGRMFFTVLAAMCEFERECGMERIHAGIANAKANGTRSGKAIGNPVKMTESKKELARIALAQANASYAKVARTLGVSRSTLYAAIPPGSVE